MPRSIWTDEMRKRAGDRTLAYMREITPANCQKLRRLRLDRNLSMRELGAIAGVSSAAVAAIEHRRHDFGPHASTLAQIAAALGVDPKEIR